MCGWLVFFCVVIFWGEVVQASAVSSLARRGIHVDAATAQKLMNNQALLVEYQQKLQAHGITAQEYLKGKEAGLSVEEIIAQKQGIQKPKTDQEQRFASLQNGACRVIAQRCIAEPETRAFTLYNSSSGRWEGIKVHRDCWQYQYTYECGGFPSKNNCQPLRQSACEQMGSTPLKMIGGQAVIWAQKFRCPKGKGKVTKNPVDADQTGISLPDDKNTMAYEGSKDLNQAIASLEVLKEIQNDLGLNKTVQDNAQKIFSVFKGNSLPCDNDLLNFNDCCQKMGGWGNNLGLTKCSADEKKLAELRDRGLCHEIPGDFCAQKILGKCVRKRRHFCCFPSKLSRIVHEQGRPQLGIGWGDAEHPQCRGFQIEELGKVDFSQLNLSELYAGIQAKMQDKTAGIASRNLTDRLKQMTTRRKNATQQ